MFVRVARRLWKDYFTHDVNAVVFIVDSADHKRFPEAKKELDGLLSSDELQKTPFLILGNKIDMNGAVSEMQLLHALGLTGMTTGKNQTNLRDIRPIEVFMCSILNSMGYREGRLSPPAALFPLCMSLCSDTFDLGNSSAGFQWLSNFMN